MHLWGGGLRSKWWNRRRSARSGDFGSWAGALLWLVVGVGVGVCVAGRTISSSSTQDPAPAPAAWHRLDGRRQRHLRFTLANATGLSHFAPNVTSAAAFVAGRGRSSLVADFDVRPGQPGISFLQLEPPHARAKSVFNPLQTHHPSDTPLAQPLKQAKTSDERQLAGWRRLCRAPRGREARARTECQQPDSGSGPLTHSAAFQEA